MTLFNIDLTAVQDIKPIPAGTYAFKVIDIDGSKQSKNGNAKMIVKCEILAPREVAEKQKNVWISLSLVETALFKVKQFVQACGVPIKASGFNSADLLNRKFGAVVTEEHSKDYGHRNQYASFVPANNELKPEVDRAAFEAFIKSLTAPAPAEGQPAAS